MEIILAIRAAFDSGCVHRRLFAAICFGPEDFDRDCSDFFRCPARLSPERPATDIPSVAARCNKRWRRSRVSGRTNGNRRWNISDAAPAFLPVGPHSRGRCCLGALHLGELDCRANWLLHESSFHTFPRIHSRGGSNHRRFDRLAFGEQTFCRASDLVLPRDGAAYRGNQIDFYEVAAIDLNGLSGSGAPPLPLALVPCRGTMD